MSHLDRPAVVESLSFEAILQSIKAEIVRLLPQAASVIELESEPLNILAQAFAYRELLYRARVNDAAQAQYIETATGSDLDHKADFYGLSRLAGESDERLRERLRLHIAALAGNGTRQAYEARALAAHPGVRQAAASAHPTLPGAVTVMLWPARGHDPQAVRDAVQRALESDPARIMGVPVQVALARAVPLRVRAQVERAEGAPADLLDRLRERLQAALQSWPLGRSLPRSWVSAQLYAPGVAAVTFPNAAEPPELLAIRPGEYADLQAVELAEA